jgi:UDP-N-acetylenolpyruvoylglucosamine reductase
VIEISSKFDQGFYSIYNVFLRHSPAQGSTGGIISAIHLRPSTDKESHNVGMACPSSAHKRGKTIDIGVVYVGSFFNKQLNDRKGARSSGADKGCQSALVRFVGIDTCC